MALLMVSDSRAPPTAERIDPVFPPDSLVDCLATIGLARLPTLKESRTDPVIKIFWYLCICKRAIRESKHWCSQSILPEEHDGWNNYETEGRQ